MEVERGNCRREVRILISLIFCMKIFRSTGKASFIDLMFYKIRA